MKYKLRCYDVDDNYNEIPNTGCGEVDTITMSLGWLSDELTDPELYQYDISMRNDGEFFFTDDQKKRLPIDLDQNWLIRRFKYKANDPDNQNYLDMGICATCDMRDVQIERGE